MTLTEIILSVIAVSLFVGYVQMAMKFWKNIKIMSVLIQDYIMIQQLLDKDAKPVEQDAMAVHTENFIKFLSDSREWAFDYIETSIGEIKQILSLIESKPGDPGIIEDIKSRLEKLIDSGRKQDETID